MPDNHSRAAGYGGVRPEPVDPITRVAAYFRQLAHTGFYGSATISFQHGAIVNVRVEQSYKPQNLPASASDALPSSETPRVNHHAEAK